MPNLSLIPNANVMIFGSISETPAISFGRTFSININTATLPFSNAPRNDSFMPSNAVERLALIISIFSFAPSNTFLILSITPPMTSWMPSQFFAHATVNAADSTLSAKSGFIITRTAAPIAIAYFVASG